MRMCWWKATNTVSSRRSNLRSSPNLLKAFSRTATCACGHVYDMQTLQLRVSLSFQDSQVGVKG